MFLELLLLPDGKKVVSASLDNTLKVWDLSSGENIATFKGHDSSVNWDCYLFLMGKK